jgi:hypothetical protein
VSYKGNGFQFLARGGTSLWSGETSEVSQGTSTCWDTGRGGVPCVCVLATEILPPYPENVVYKLLFFHFFQVDFIIAPKYFCPLCGNNGHLI